MGEKIKNYIKQEKNDILKAFLVLIIVSGSYLGYLYFVGIPMTRAKNYFNLGYLNYQDRNFQEAKVALTTSLKYFYSQEASDLLRKIN